VRPEGRRMTSFEGRNRGRFGTVVPGTMGCRGHEQWAEAGGVEARLREISLAAHTGAINELVLHR